MCVSDLLVDLQMFRYSLGIYQRLRGCTKPRQVSFCLSCYKYIAFSIYRSVHSNSALALLIYRSVHSNSALALLIYRSVHSNSALALLIYRSVHSNSNSNSNSALAFKCMKFQSLLSSL